MVRVKEKQLRGITILDKDGYTLINASDARMINLSTPIDGYDAVTKNYADSISGSGSGTLTEALALGNVTGSYDIEISSGDSITSEANASGRGGTLSLISGTGGGTEGSGNISIESSANGGATGASGSITLETGAGNSGSSGSIILETGSGDAAGSGSVSITTGSGLGGDVGNISVSTGVPTTGTSGNIFIFTQTGSGADAGDISLSTGNANVTPGNFSYNAGHNIGAGDGGRFTINTGNAVTGDGGRFQVSLGDVSTNGNGGAFEFFAGDGGSASGNGGYFQFQAGNSSTSSPAGGFTLNAGNNSSTGVGGDIILTPGTSSGASDGLVYIYGDGYVTNDFTILGKLTVAGLIDPTGMVFDNQISVPGGVPDIDKSTLWIKDGYGSAIVTSNSGDDNELTTLTSTDGYGNSVDYGFTIRKIKRFSLPPDNQAFRIGILSYEEYLTRLGFTPDTFDNKVAISVKVWFNATEATGSGYDNGQTFRSATINNEFSASNFNIVMSDADHGTFGALTIDMDTTDGITVYWEDASMSDGLNCILDCEIITSAPYLENSLEEIFVLP